MRQWHTGRLTRADGWDILNRAYMQLIESEHACFFNPTNARGQWKEENEDEAANWRARQTLVQLMETLPSPAHVQELTEAREEERAHHAIIEG